MQVRIKKIWNKRRDRKKVTNNNIRKEYGISKVAKIYRVTRTTLMEWIAKFKEKGVIGFAIQPGRGPKAKLNEKKKEKIREIIEKEGANLTAKKLQVIVERMFAIKISELTAGRLMEKPKIYIYHTSPRTL